MRRFRVAKTAVIGFALSALVVIALPCLSADLSSPIKYGPPRQLAEIKNGDIDESSGIAVSIRNRDSFWTHNDSGDRPCLYLINRSGETLADIRIKGARAKDWEDIASFRWGRSVYLIVGDTGKSVLSARNTLYIINEPVINSRVRTVEPAITIKFKYEDGHHDCESIAVDPVLGKIYLVTKSTNNKDRECRVYELPFPNTKGEFELTAQAIAVLKIPMVTAMDISPDGLRAIVLTYSDAYEYTREKDETWSEAFARGPRRIKMPKRKQGESICYGPDGKTLYLTDEGKTPPLWEVPVLGDQ